MFVLHTSVPLTRPTIGTMTSIVNQFLTLLNKIDSAEFMIKGNVMIMADFNAHVPINTLDYIADDDLYSHIPLPKNVYSPDVQLARNTMELRELNQNGKSWIEMC